MAAPASDALFERGRMTPGAPRRAPCVGPNSWISVAAMFASVASLYAERPTIPGMSP